MRYKNKNFFFIIVLKVTFDENVEKKNFYVKFWKEFLKIKELFPPKIKNFKNELLFLSLILNLRTSGNYVVKMSKWYLPKTFFE